jgi:hypothetical protein
LAFEGKGGRPKVDPRDQKVARLEARLVEKTEVVAELLQEHVQLKKRTWGTLNGRWVPHQTRDEIVDYVRYWSHRGQVTIGQIVKWIGLGASKFYDWRDRYGQVTEHNAQLPRDHWLEPWEREAIIAGYYQHPHDGYRRLTYLLMDADQVAVSPATTYRVLKQAGLLASQRHRRHPTFLANLGGLGRTVFADKRASQIAQMPRKNRVTESRRMTGSRRIQRKQAILTTEDTKSTKVTSEDLRALRALRDTYIRHIAMSFSAISSFPCRACGRGEYINPAIHPRWLLGRFVGGERGQSAGQPAFGQDGQGHAVLQIRPKDGQQQQG